MTVSILNEIKSAADAAASLRAIVTHFKADSGTIHLLGDDGMLHLQSAANIPPPVMETVRTIPVGKGMAGLAVERRAAVDACNIQTDTSGNVRPGAKATGLAGAIVVPIWRGDEVIGALGIANRAERTFSEQEIALLTDCGRAIACSNDAGSTNT